MHTYSLAVLAVAFLACVCDIRTRRIPNRLTYGAAALGLLVNLALGGLSALAWSAAGWGTAVILFLPFFALRGMGAGDVKLLGAIGAWLGPLHALYLAFFTAIAGGILAVFVVLIRGYVRQAARNLWLLLTHWRIAGIRPLPEVTLESGTGPRLAYAIPIALGTVTTLWLR